MSRNISLDLLRIIACFMVVGIHTTPIFINENTSQNNINILLQSFYRVGLPIFFIISGSFLLNRETTINISWYAKSLPKILIPFIIISFAHYIYIHGISFSTPFNYLKIISTTMTGVSTHFWFVYVITLLYIVSPAINLLLSKISEKGSIIILSISLVIYALLSNYSFVYKLFGMPALNFTPGPYVWILYFSFGGLLSRCAPRINNVATITFLCLGFTFTYLLGLLRTSHYQIDLRPYDINASMLMYASALFVFFFNINRKMNSISMYLKSLIISISDKTYFVYLVHIIVLDVLTYKFYSFSEFIQTYNIYILMTAICLSTSLALAYAFNPLIHKVINLLTINDNVGR